MTLTTGQQITTSNNVSIFKQSGGYKIIVSSSRQRAGDIFLDPDILKIVDKNNFEKVSDKMVATFDEDSIGDFISILQDKFNVSVSLKPEQFSLIKNDLPERAARVKPALKSTPKPKPASNNLELEAMALEIELELMEFEG